jgi:c-di-GMP-binding flagellar brake protein YcgR
MSNPPVLLVDDGELNDVRAVLEEIGAEFAHLRGGAVPSGVEPPDQLFIATPRRAMLAKDWPAGPLPVKIGVVTEDSNTLRSMLKRIGFDLLVRRPVHPYALRLVLLRALYSGSERRKDQRLPIGYPVSYRSGFRRKTATLADLSMRGARLLVDSSLALGGRLTLQIDREIAGDKALSIRSKVVRVSEEPEQDGQYIAGIQFENPNRDTLVRVREILKASAEGPLTVEAPENPEAPAGIETEEPPTAAPATPENRRKHGRAVFRREIVQLDDEASSVLLGRDISLGGMRVDCESTLGLGDQLRLAIYGGPREDPFILRGTVVRRETATTYGVKFADLKPAVAARLESLVSNLPAVESLKGSEADALGSVVSRILEREEAETPEDAAHGA